jgi:hypothetical protein
MLLPIDLKIKNRRLLMKYVTGLSVLALLAASSAHAQEGSYSRTLDEQHQRMQMGQSAQPAPGTATAPMAPMTVQQRQAKEWPASPALATRPMAAGAPNRVSYGQPLDSQGSGAIPALPLAVQSSGGATFITGGIGDEEEAQLKSTAGQYNLRLMMTAPGGEYVSDINLRLLNAQGQQVVAINDAGPYFYANVPPGAYTVEMSSAQSGNKALKVNVPASGAYRQHIAFAETGGIVSPHTPRATID